MRKICQRSCAIWENDKLQRIPFTLSNQEDQFYEFEANNATGHPINFERFEGYVSIP